MRFAAAVVLLGGLSAAQSIAPFSVGVLRRDGVVIPFATFDGKRWSTSWPLPTIDRAIPINVTSVPRSWWGKAGVREEWQLWVDAAPQTARVTQPDVVDVHCVQQIGLRTDYRSAEPAPPPTEQPYPKDGLAVSPPQPVEHVAILAPGAIELLPLWPTLRDAFNKAERETASRFRDPLGERARERIDPQIEAAYAYGVDPRYYYVESSRTYRTLGNESCSIAFGTGWIVKVGDGFKPLATSVDILPCNRYGATYMLPFGAMTLGGRTYWLAQFSGWDHERFVIVDIKPKEVEAMVNVWGGGC